MNNKLRANKKDDFEKGFFKLMNISVFGKAIEKCEEAQRYQVSNNR